VITFDDARQVVADSASVREFFGDGFTVATHGWQNSDVFLIAVETSDGEPVFDAPELLVDKRTGELREIFGLLGRDPAPNLVPIGDAPA